MNNSKKVCYVFGAVFALVGVIGLIGGLGIVGPNGVFVTDTMHDLVHLVSGVVLLLVAAKAPGASSKAMIIFGVVYGLVTILGFMSSGGMVLGMMMNAADNYLHLLLTLGLLIGGFATKGGTPAPSWQA